MKTLRKYHFEQLIQKGAAKDKEANSDPDQPSLGPNELVTYQSIFLLLCCSLQWTRLFYFHFIMAQISICFCFVDPPAILQQTARRRIVH